MLGAAQLLGAKPRPEPELELFLVYLSIQSIMGNPIWATVQETVEPQ